MLGARLLEEGWAVRGTSRDAAGLEAIESAGIEPALADPDRPAGLLDLVGDVTVVHWLLGSARGEPEAIAAIHGPRLERFMEKLVDTPVRGFVYEARGSVESHLLEEGGEIVRVAAATWRIPVEAVGADPTDPSGWADRMLEATLRLVR